jgi:hypothetical protein
MNRVLSSTERILMFTLRKGVTLVEGFERVNNVDIIYDSELLFLNSCCDEAKWTKNKFWEKS